MLTPRQCQSIFNRVRRRSVKGDERFTLRTFEMTGSTKADISYHDGAERVTIEFHRTSAGIIPRKRINGSLGIVVDSEEVYELLGL